MIMKNKKMNLSKLKLNKMTISSLQSLKGGIEQLQHIGDDATEASACPPCDSINTKFTKIAHCC